MSSNDSEFSIPAQNQTTSAKNQTNPVSSMVPISFSLSGTPTITSEKLNGKNYLSWSSSVELWFLGQELFKHLSKSAKDTPEKDKSQCKKPDYQLCALLWQSIEPSILMKFRAFKTCSTFWNRVHNVFANDIQRLCDASQKLASLKQTDHDMTLFVSQEQAAVEELKLYLQADSLEGCSQN